MKDFYKEKSTLEDKENELNKINDKIDKYIKASLSNLSENEFQNYIDLCDKRIEVEKQIVDIKTNTHEVEYYINNADLIFKYYDIVENGNILENETNALITENSILKFFKSPREEDYEDVDEEHPIKKEDDRATILDKYMQHTDNNYMKEKDSGENDTCPVCNSRTRTLLVNDGLMYCNDCHTIETIIIDHEKPKWLGVIVVIVLTASFLYL